MLAKSSIIGWICNKARYCCNRCSIHNWILINSFNNFENCFWDFNGHAANIWKDNGDGHYIIYDVLWHPYHTIFDRILAIHILFHNLWYWRWVHLQSNISCDRWLDSKKNEGGTSLSKSLFAYIAGSDHWPGYSW